MNVTMNLTAEEALVLDWVAKMAGVDISAFCYDLVRNRAIQEKAQYDAEETTSLKEGIGLLTKAEQADIADKIAKAKDKVKAEAALKEEEEKPKEG